MIGGRAAGPGRRSCSACGSTLAVAALLCAHCGTRVPPFGAAADEGQRRWLTVTFTDVMGSTELSRQLDPEDYGDMMLRYQNLCGEVVERRGGHLASYAGDGLLAVFGWPTSHERDADLAVYAALDLLDELHVLNDYLGGNLRCPTLAYGSVSTPAWQSWANWGEAAEWTRLCSVTSETWRRAFSTRRRRTAWWSAT